MGKYGIENIIGKKYGFLTVCRDQSLDNINSNSRLTFECECGNKKEIILKSVVNGSTTSCGCGLARPKGNKFGINNSKSKTKQFWLSYNLPMKLLDVDLPEKWQRGSGKKMYFKCNCGNICLKQFGKVYSGHTKTCGRCNFITRDEALSLDYGDLELLGEIPSSFHKNTSERLKFRCKCGNIKRLEYSKVVSGLIIKCGECNLKMPSWWDGRKFGHLTVIRPDLSISIGSDRLLKCRCTCGSICTKSAYELTSKHVKTCGNCVTKCKEWWHSKPPLPSIKSNIYELPDLETYFYGCNIQPLESAKTTNTYIDFRCKLCGEKFRSKLSWAYHSKISSCGCVGGSVSSQNIEIAKFIKNLGFDDVNYGNNEFSIENYKFDIKCGRLIIEHHGLRYHSGADKYKIDMYKFNLAIENGFDIIVIYEDEWKSKKDIFMNIIRNRLGAQNALSVRPSECGIELIGNNECCEFYNSNHYIGHVNSKYNIGCYYSGELVACMSIKKPSRQKSGDWEISRMACDPNYRVHGIWSYIMKWVVCNKIVNGKLITYSDNRLFSGRIYNIMGMKFEHNVRPDYYWCDKYNRYHKSSMRKSKEEKATDMTESELRHEQGFRKIFDYGKKKWSIFI